MDLEPNFVVYREIGIVVGSQLSNTIGDTTSDRRASPDHSRGDEKTKLTCRAPATQTPPLFQPQPTWRAPPPPSDLQPLPPCLPCQLGLTQALKDSDNNDN